MKLITFDQDQQLRDYENFKKRDIKNILIRWTNLCYDIINIIKIYSVPEAKLEEKANLSGINLVGYNLWKHKEIKWWYNLQEANLQGADLRNAILQGAILQGADLQGADLRWSDLYKAKLQEADLREANLRGANLREANLRRADLRWSDLQGVNLRRAYLRGADLRDADLQGADLRWAITNDKEFHKKYPQTNFVYG